MARQKGQAAVEKKNARLEQLHIEYIAPAEISPNPWNPNRQSEHDFELLTRSMREDGFTQPIIVMRVTEASKEEDEALQRFGVGQLVIVDGEHRWRAGQELGYEKVPTVEVPMNVAQARIATLRHNRARGSEDFELSAQVLRDLEELGAMDWAQDSLMLEDEEIARMLEDVPAPEALAEEEWSEAWAPSSGEHDEDVELRDREASATPAAIEARREGERKIAEAKSEEERAALRRDMDVYRVALSFAGEESRIVRAVVGAEPATAILELCREVLVREGRLNDVVDEEEAA